MDDMVRGNFALLNGDVHDLVQAGAIARRVNVRHGGLHVFVRDDSSKLQSATPIFLISRARDATFGMRPSAKDVFRPNTRYRFTFVLKKNFL